MDYEAEMEIKDTHKEENVDFYLEQFYDYVLVVPKNILPEEKNSIDIQG